MCRLYETSVEYVLYGNDRMAFFERRSSSLTALFMPLYAKRVAYDRESGSIDILEEKLKYQISLLDDYLSVSDISNIEDLYRLAEDIKKIEEDR